MYSTAASIVVFVGLVLVFFWAMQRRLMYFPSGDVPPPAELGLAGAEAVSFPTTDGLTLRGWFFSAPPVRSRPMTVLVFNGNAGNRAYRGGLAVALRRLGLQVLLFDYRGYGGNPGSPTERGLFADARAARAYLVSRSDVDPSRIVYFGESLGTGVAVDLAVEHPPAGVILRSPYTSMTDIGRHHYPFLPVGPLLRDRFESISKVSRIRAPLLVVAGRRDQIVPAENTR